MKYAGESGYKGQSLERREQLPTFEVAFSLDKEITRVTATLRELLWLKENSYQVDLPAGLGAESSAEEIAGAVANEYHEEDFTSYTNTLQSELAITMEIVSPHIKDLPFSLRPDYRINLSKYGTGGSYNHASGEVFINIQKRANFKTAVQVIWYEIIHIAIEPLVRQYGISHWAKERTVDRLAEKHFRGAVTIAGLKPGQEETEEIKVLDSLFDTDDGDVERVFKALAEKDKSKLG